MAGRFRPAEVGALVIVVPDNAAPPTRWLVHLVRAAAGAIRPGDRFDDDLPFEPDAILRLAMRQGVAPLLHRGSADGRIGDPLPGAFRSACWRSYYTTVRNNVIALETGRDVLSALADAGVDAAPLAAWPLLEGPGSVYDDVGTRPVGDLELIVKPAARGRAARVLRGLGFVRTGGSAFAAKASPHRLAFRTRAFDLDLFVSLGWAWDRAGGRFAGEPVSGERFLDGLCAPWPTHAHVYTPTRVGNLLVAAARAGRHSLTRWVWLLDLHRLVLASSLDWDAVVRDARLWRARGSLYAGLAATRELFRTPVPKEVLAALAPGPLRRRLLRRYLAAGARGAQRSAHVARLLLGESWWDVARAAAAGAVPGPPRLLDRAPRRPWLDVRRGDRFQTLLGRR
ncbi:MAG: nucleotidyltransferase family protein [Deltaproteobacteria bacterium]|nr:MAG: nucleotidyltransferase family protein [Deltaproteobacteria bacterium]